MRAQILEPGLGILFPGQGAQHEGMGRDWAEVSGAARRTFEEADELLGLPLSELCWSGGEAIHRTEYAQPGIFVTSVAIVRALEEHGLARERVGMTAGLSLGEYSALWCAGSLDFADGLRLVRLRGEAMQAAGEGTPSGMLSLLGADEAQAEALARAASTAGICSVANLNAPGQVVLSGELAALDAAEAAAKDHGVRRTKRLVVSGGFHSECMRPAAESLRAALAEVPLRPPRVPFVSNVTGGPSADVEEIRAQLAAQVCAPVRWEQGLRWALARGVRTFLEPGPGNVLAGLLKKIDPEALVHCAATPADAGL